MDITAITKQEVNDLEEAFQSEASFRAWYDRVLPRVYGYVLGHVSGQRELAEEITQQTFTDAIRGYRGFDGRSDSVTWLCSIARHKLADHWRRLERDERRRLRLISGPADDRDTGMWQSADQRDRVMSALERLPATQRAALLLHYVDGMSVREIGKELGKSEKAIESILSRGRAGFRNVYGQDIDG